MKNSLFFSFCYLTGGESKTEDESTGGGAAAWQPPQRQHHQLASSSALEIAPKRSLITFVFIRGLVCVTPQSLRPCKVKLFFRLVLCVSERALVSISPHPHTEAGSSMDRQRKQILRQPAFFSFLQNDPFSPPTPPGCWRETCVSSAHIPACTKPLER